MKTDIHGCGATRVYISYSDRIAGTISWLHSPADSITPAPRWRRRRPTSPGLKTFGGENDVLGPLVKRVPGLDVKQLLQKVVVVEVTARGEVIIRMEVMGGARGVHRESL